MRPSTAPFIVQQVGQKQNNHATLEPARHDAGWLPGAHRLRWRWRWLPLASHQLATLFHQPAKPSPWHTPGVGPTLPLQPHPRRQRAHHPDRLAGSGLDHKRSQATRRHGRYRKSGRFQYGRQLPWLTTRPLHATTSGDNTATQQWCLARSRGRLPMMSGPGADLSKPPMRHWQAHRRQPHRHGQRQLARLPKQPAPTTSNASTAPPGCTSTTCRSHGSRQSSDGAISPSPTAFSQGSAGDHHIHGRFHGQDHSEGWGIFHTNAYVGAFCAKRQLQQWPEPSQFRRCCKRFALRQQAASAERRLSGGSCVARVLA